MVDPFQGASKPEFIQISQNLNQQGLHKGIDLHVPDGTPVYAVHAGVPTQVTFTDFSRFDFYFTIELKDTSNLIIGYTHLDPLSVPDNVREAIKGHQLISRGTFLGNVASTATLNSPLRSHLHFSVLDCANGLHLNPLFYLSYEDKMAPTIFGIYLKPLSSDSLRKSESNRSVVSGIVEIITEIGDSINGSAPKFPPHRIEYEIAPDSELVQSGIPKTVLFDASSFPVEANCEMANSEYIHFADILYYMNYAENEFDYIEQTYGDHVGPWLIAVTDSKVQKHLSDPDFEYRPFPKNTIQPISGGWNTAACNSKGDRLFPDGGYTIKIYAADAKGNASQLYRHVQVQNKACLP